MIYQALGLQGGVRWQLPSQSPSSSRMVVQAWTADLERHGPLPEGSSEPGVGWGRGVWEKFCAQGEDASLEMGQRG